MPQRYTPARTWPDEGLAGFDPEELAGLGSTLKKIGKKIGNALKPKNLLKTAAVAAVAYGGYKLATSDTGKDVLSKVGSGLAKVGSAAATLIPKVAESYIQYQTAGAQQMPVEMGMTDSLAYAQPQATTDYVTAPRPGFLMPDGTFQTESLNPIIGSPQASTMPGWVIPAAIGAGVFLLVTSRR